MRSIYLSILRGCVPEVNLRHVSHLFKELFHLSKCYLKKKHEGLYPDVTFNLQSNCQWLGC